MDKNYFIQLTNNLYRLTLFFPKKEPLRYKMRELADSILINPNEKDLEVLNSFFEIAKNQNWVSVSDILAIQGEYDSLKKELEEKKLTAVDFSTDREGKIIEVGPQSISLRQEKILAFLRENGRAQVWQLKQIFPEVTKRTLRRDFEQMLGQGLIERLGERNNTFYQVKINQS